MVTVPTVDAIAAHLPEALKLPLGLPRDLGPSVAVALTKERVALISPEDESRVSEFHWHAKFNKSSGEWYARHCTTRKKKVVVQLLHRFIRNVTDPQTCVVHLNHDTLDNRRENLKLIDRTLFAKFVSTRRSPAHSAGLKGVTYRKDRWEAYVTRGGKSYHLGYFRTAVDAALAYNTKAREFYGDDAFLNDVLHLAQIPDAELCDRVDERASRHPKRKRLTA